MTDLTEREQIVAWLRDTIVSDLAALADATMHDPAAVLSALATRALIANAIERGEHLGE